MVCPKCRMEYPPGLLRCSACEVPLEEAPPADAAPFDEQLVDLVKTADPALLAVIKSVLDSSGIAYLVQGEEGLRILPVGLSGGFFNPAGLGAVIRVRREDLTDAMQALDARTPPPADED